VAEPDRSIAFVETHYHLWELDHLRYAWLDEPGDDAKTAYLGDYRRLREDWGPARLAEAFEGSTVFKAVHVEADQSGPDPVAETAWLASVAARSGMPNAIVAYADLEREGVEAALDRHLAASDLVRGVRIREHPADPTSRAFVRSLAALAARGLSYDVNAQPGRLQRIYRI
jgi:predicted TIM-barrel fold metal-dependent hydrolase